MNILHRSAGIRSAGDDFGLLSINAVGSARHGSRPVADRSAGGRAVRRWPPVAEVLKGGSDPIPLTGKPPGWPCTGRAHIEYTRAAG